MPEDQAKNEGDLSRAFNEGNILCPTTLDQLSEHLRKDVEAKNTTNVATALGACSFKTRSSNVAEQDKQVNIQVFTFDGTLKVNPLPSEPPSGLFTPEEQLKWMDEK
ncbi:unnamed protein product [Miscanthus lutarioriparius]|uniref:Uncharacterized protein n=1 Tax=Miscanthus lutarioriparius TaxID=422564 RepID=A0A811SA59_9POAL|nr:unnamed protein product [Miscanthus lutarioriparius]